MKLGKLSLVAVMALGTSAFAIDNVKVNGDVKVIYQSNDVDGSAFDMFDQGASAAGVGLRIGATADLTSGVSAGIEGQAFSTLGLENNLVSSVMATGQVNDASAASQAWIAATLGKTTVKIGRQELATPLAFTEKWNVVNNTFDAAVILNNDLPETTLVGAWVGKHNGMGSTGLLINSTGQTAALTNNPYDSFYGGAYAAGIVNKSIPNTTAQAWYYNVGDTADAYWLQADTKVMDMVSLGAQYANMDPKDTISATLKDSQIWAVKGAVDVSGVNLYVAYSSADKDGTLGFANTSTGDKTMIYTGLDSIYMDGIVTRPGTDAIKVGASAALAGVKVAAAYTDCDGEAVNSDISGIDLSVSGNVGALGLQAIYTMVDNDTASGNYGNVDRDTIRLIAQLKF
jgi:hypothetical protein